MSNFKNVSAIFITILVTLLLTACSPEVGSDKWCEQMKGKPKGDWSANEATNYAKNCVF